jgi:hypothetical protein
LICCIQVSKGRRFPRALLPMSCNDSANAMNTSSNESSVWLSSILVAWFRAGVPLALLATWIGSVLAYVPRHGLGTVPILAYTFSGIVFVLIGRRSIRLSTVRVIGQNICFTGLCRVDVCPVSDLTEVSVKYRRGIPWAVFRLSPPAESGIREYHTILQPKLEYLFTKRLSDLEVFHGLRVRYTDYLGRERLEIIGMTNNDKVK